MRRVELKNVQNRIMEQLKKGAFLTSKTGDKANTMTIAWGMAGRMWDRDCFSVAVRHSRHSFGRMEESEYFTVSIPKKGTLKKELGVCGTASGRDIDKFKECGLSEVDLPDCGVPVVGECEIHVVCRISYKQSMEPSLVGADYVKNKYKTHDYHTIYYGEVIAVYENDDMKDLD